MTKKRTILFLVVVLTIFADLRGQDPVFSHFHANSLRTNPALAGADGPMRIYAGYRNQWPASGSAYNTYEAAFDQYYEKLQGGIGVHVFNDRQGVGTFNSVHLDVMYAYQFRASRRLSFSGALQAGAGQRSFNPGQLVFGDMLDPLTGDIVGVGEEIQGYNRLFPDFATGVAANYDNIYGGIAVHHLLRPNVTDDPAGRLARRYTVHAGIMIPVYEKGRGREIVTLSPGMVYIQQQRIQQISYGLDVVYRDFLVGLQARHDWFFDYGNIIFSMGYDAGKVRFRYSYDVRLSSPAVRLPTMGAHEISLLIINQKQGIRKHRSAIKYPKI